VGFVSVHPDGGDQSGDVADDGHDGAGEQEEDAHPGSHGHGKGDDVADHQEGEDHPHAVAGFGDGDFFAVDGKKIAGAVDVHADEIAHGLRGGGGGGLQGGGDVVAAGGQD